ncbi:MAG: class I SAM-dependent RNA methyltransferase [Pseudomonadota bacterium]
MAQEATEAGFADASVQPGGVAVAGGWPEVWRANLVLRGTTRVLVRLASFRVLHLAQLDKRARRLPWRDWLPDGQAVSVETSCRKSRIYHAGAASARIAGAVEAAGLTHRSGGLRILARIEDDLCTISIDSSGEPLHKRGFKLAVGKAPLRETLAALFLRAAGYRSEALIDPMCGSGTLPIEAAEFTAGLLPGRARRFAFEHLAGFDPEAFEAMRAHPFPTTPQPAPEPARHPVTGPASQGAASPSVGPAVIIASDRDAGAVEMARANAARAGVEPRLAFRCAAISEVAPPEVDPGLVIVNPPYGARIGKTGALPALYRAFGSAMRDRFAGWRIALITSEPELARATGLPFAPPGLPVPHGPLKIRLYQAQL